FAEDERRTAAVMARPWAGSLRSSAAGSAAAIRGEHGPRSPWSPEVRGPPARQWSSCYRLPPPPPGPPPRRGRNTDEAFERAAERGLRLVADLLGDRRHLRVARRQPSGRELHTPLGEELHRGLADDGGAAG